MSFYKFSRRSMLAAAGGSAALLLPLLRNIEARAEGAKAPLRLLIIHHPLGTTSGLVNWVPQLYTPGAAFDLPMESAPFAPLQSQMVLIDGLNLVTDTASTTTTNSGSNTHQGGTVALMTGVPTLGLVGQQDHCAGGASIDQLLLEQSPVLGGAGALIKTPFQSLALAADIRSDRDEVSTRVLSYKAPVANVNVGLARQPIYPVTQPLDTYNRIFGGALPTGTEPSALLAQKLSVLDFMRGDLARLNSLVPASEKDRLVAHAMAIQSLEASLRKSYAPAPAAGSCTTPAVPPQYTPIGERGNGQIGGTSNTPSNLTGEDYYPASPNCTPSAAVTCHANEDIAINQLRLIKTAFACDLVRIATFMYAPGENWVVFPATFQGATLPDSALGNDGQSCPHHPLSHAVDPLIQAWLGQIDQYYSTITCQMLQEFAATPDIDGNTLLDNTVVVYVTEVTRSWDHTQQNIPVLVFGGKNTGVKGGTYLSITDGQLAGVTGSVGNRPFNDLWLALAPVFGVHWPSLGSERQFTGPLPGIFT